MSNTVIELRHSYVTGNVPISLANGEIAINTYDGKLFYRGGVSNTVQTIERYEGPAGLDGEIQFNSSGVLGSNPSLFFDQSTNTLEVLNLLTRIIPRSVNASANSGTLIVNANTTDIFVAEGLTNSIIIDTPAGTPNNGQKLLIRIKDDGTSRAITWTTTSGAFREVGVTLPTTTTANKLTYVGCIYNSTDLFWDVVATVTQT